MNILEPKRRRAQRRTSAIGLLSADDEVAFDNSKRYSGKNGSYMERIRQGMESVQHSMETQLEVAISNIASATAKNDGGNGPADANVTTSKTGAVNGNLGLSISGTINNLVSKASVAAVVPTNMANLGTVVGAETKNTAWASMEDDDSLSNMDVPTDNWANNALHSSFGGFENGFPDIPSDFNQFSGEPDNSFDDDGFFSQSISQFGPAFEESTSPEDGTKLEAKTIAQFDPGNSEVSSPSIFDGTKLEATNIAQFDPGTSEVSSPPIFDGTKLDATNIAQFDPDALGGQVGASAPIISDEKKESSTTSQRRSSRGQKSKSGSGESSRSRSRSKSKSRGSRSRSHSRKRGTNSRSKVAALREANSKDKPENQVAEEAKGDNKIISTSRHRSNLSNKGSASKRENANSEKRLSGVRSFHLRLPKDQLAQSEHIPGRKKVARTRSMQLKSSSQHRASNRIDNPSSENNDKQKTRSNRDSIAQSEHRRSRSRSRPRATRPSMSSRSTRTKPSAINQSADEALDTETSASNRRSRLSVNDRRAGFHSRRSNSFRHTNGRAQHLDAERKKSDDEGAKTKGNAEKPAREGRRNRGLIRSSSMDAAEMKTALYGTTEKTSIRRKLKNESNKDEAAGESSLHKVNPESRPSSAHGREAALRMMSVDGKLAW